jgi:WD40 repeat protein
MIHIQFYSKKALPSPLRPDGQTAPQKVPRLMANELYIDATRTLPPETFKRLYVVESKRFRDERKPKAAVFCCHSTNRIIAAHAVDRKMDVISFSVSAKASPVAKKFSFESAVLAVSGCESLSGYSLFVLLETQSFFVHENGTIVFLSDFSATVAVIAPSGERNLALFGGSEEGTLMRAEFDDRLQLPNMQSVTAASSGIQQLRLANELLACGFVNGTISIFRAAKLEQVWTNRFHNGTIRCLAWNPRADLLAFAGEDDDFYIIDINRDYDVFRFTGHNSFVSDLSFEVAHPDNVRIFSAAEDSMCGCWDLVDGQTSNSAMFGPQQTPIRHIACFRKILLMVDSGGTIMCWRRVKHRAASGR